MSIAIIGSGISGLAAAHGLHRAGFSPVLYEAKPYWGGHAHSDQIDGFWFDEGPHLSFTSDNRVRRIFDLGTAEGSGEFTSKIFCYYDERWLQYPPQVHLHGLDPAFITQCITDFIDAGRQDRAEISNYADWLIAAYGKTFAQNFPLPYTRKYWTVEASQMGVDWVRQRMYVPTLDEVLLGALDPANAGDFHYLKSYRYPTQGGFQSYLGELARDARIEMGKAVTRINISSKELHFSDNSSCEYDSLISTIPLDRLVRCIEGVHVPIAVRDATQDLLCTSVALVDLGISYQPAVEFDWFYVYDEAISFSRVSFPYRLSPSMAPRGLGSIQAEIYFSRERPLGTAAGELVPRVVNELIKIGILRDSTDVVASRVRIVPYANVVYDHRRAPALAVIMPFIQQCGITLAGRYAEWEYYWTDDAANAGWRAGAAVTGLDVSELLGERTQQPK